MATQVHVHVCITQIVSVIVPWLNLNLNNSVRMIEFIRMDEFSHFFFIFGEEDENVKRFNNDEQISIRKVRRLGVVYRAMTVVDILKR